MNKLKDISKALITLSYIFMIGALIVNNEHFIYKEHYLLILNIVLLCIGLYYFVQLNNK